MPRSTLPAIPRSVLWMVVLSFFLQIAAIGIFRQYHTRPGQDNFGFGFEMGRVGRSIALGRGFSQALLKKYHRAIEPPAQNRRCIPT